MAPTSPSLFKHKYWKMKLENELEKWLLWFHIFHFVLYSFHLYSNWSHPVICWVSFLCLPLSARWPDFVLFWSFSLSCCQGFMSGQNMKRKFSRCCLHALNLTLPVSFTWTKGILFHSMRLSTTLCLFVVSFNSVKCLSCLKIYLRSFWAQEKNFSLSYHVYKMFYDLSYKVDLTILTVLNWEMLFRCFF